MENRLLLKQYDVALDTVSAIVKELADELGGDVTLRQAAMVAETMLAASQDRRLEMRELPHLLKVDRRRVSKDLAILTRKQDKSPCITLQASASDKRTRRVCLTTRGAKVGVQLATRLRTLLFSSRERVFQVTEEMQAT